MFKVPLSNITVERFVVRKHLVHVTNLRSVPAPEVAVEIGIREGFLHVVDLRHVPSRQDPELGLFAVLNALTIDRRFFQARVDCFLKVFVVQMDNHALLRVHIDRDVTRLVVAVVVASTKDVHVVGVRRTVNSRVKLHVLSDVLRRAAGHSGGDVRRVTRVELVRTSIRNTVSFVLLGGGGGGRFLGRLLR